MKRVIIRAKKACAAMLFTVLAVSILAAPANAYTRNTLQATKDYFVFESGIIKADWTKVISYAVDNMLVPDGIVSYRPTIYVPLGSRITLTADAVAQDYRMAVGQDLVAVAENLTVYTCDRTEEMQVIVYTPDQVDEKGNMYFDYDIRIVGVADGKATDLLTPFTDIGYCGYPF